MQKIQHKQGATFDKLLTRQDAQGDPVNLTGVTITSDFRSGDGTFSGSFTCSIIDAENGIYRVVGTSAVTATWPLSDEYQNRLYCDVKYDGGVDDIDYSETIEIVVVDNITP